MSMPTICTPGKNGDRITSYNVCYTKLLRAVVLVTERMVPVMLESRQEPFRFAHDHRFVIDWGKEIQHAADRIGVGGPEGVPGADKINLDDDLFALDVPFDLLLERFHGVVDDLTAAVPCDKGDRNNFV